MKKEQKEIRKKTKGNEEIFLDFLFIKTNQQTEERKSKRSEGNQTKNQKETTKRTTNIFGFSVFHKRQRKEHTKANNKYTRMETYTDKCNECAIRIKYVGKKYVLSQA